MNKGGRPKKKAANARVTPITARFTESEHRDIERIANAVGVPVAIWVRMRVLEGLVAK